LLDFVLVRAITLRGGRRVSLALDPVSPTIGLLGDVMLGRSVAGRLAEVAPEELWAPEVREVCASCDLVVCNLECCISDRGAPTDRVRRKPFFFRGPPDAVRSLEAIGVGAVGLANNHALDYETEALVDTLAHLDGDGIAVAGAGRDLHAARKPASLEVAGTTVGLVAVTDHPSEFAAGEKEPGIAHADLSAGLPEWLGAEFARAREECDWLIAFPHWGPNMTTEPARWQRMAAAALQEAGADLVAGHSAHVFHGVGWGARGPVVYDLGDALDDYRVDSKLRNDLGLMAIWRPGDPERELELVGLELEFCFTRVAEGPAADWIARRLDSACGELGTMVERLSVDRFRPRRAG
jgi:poly-gamma-glutamate capsule biosynthesis protein CapA/YwtB (metallophosphatase superfamily)